MNGFVTLLVTALYALLLQNLVFTGGFGASEAVRISSKPRYVLSFALFITVFSAATSIICRALELLPQVSLAHTLVRLLIYMSIVCDRSAGVSLCVACKRQHPSEDRHGGIQYASACDPCDQPQCRLYGGRISWRGPWGRRGLRSGRVSDPCGDSRAGS